MIHQCSLRICVFTWLTLILFPSVSTAKTLVALKVSPPNVGVLAQNKTQQFQAIAQFNDGSQEDYTNKVGWSLTAFPLAAQTMKPDQVAKIDKNGLLTVISTWGRVRVVATYPPPPKFSPSMISVLLLTPPTKARGLPAILSLLLLKNDNLKIDSNSGSVAGGNIIVITGYALSDGSDDDIVSVKLNGVASEVVIFNKDAIIVIAGKADAPGTGVVEVLSKSRGLQSIPEGYTYMPRGMIKQWATSGNLTLITGENIGNGSDIFRVKLLGREVEILEQSRSTILVRSGLRIAEKGTLEIYSASQGTTLKQGSPASFISMPYPVRQRSAYFAPHSSIADFALGFTPDM